MESIKNIPTDKLVEELISRENETITLPDLNQNVNFLNSAHEIHISIPKGYSIIAVKN